MNSLMNNYKEGILVMIYDYYNGIIITLYLINMEIYIIGNVHDNNFHS